MTALAATAIVGSAQEPKPGLLQVAATGDGPALTIVTDQDGATTEQSRRVAITAKAVGSPALTIAQSRSPAVTTYVAQAKNPESKTYFATRFGGVAGRSHAGSHALVIPKDAADTKSLADVEEDLGVMAHILDKAVGRDDKTARAMGITLSRWPGSSALQSLYIEGHGAIFFLNVNFPLLPPPTKESETDAKEKTSSEWEEARREISEQAKPSGAGAFGASGLTTAPLVFAGTPAAEYDADKVDDLKKDLIAALKNAAHIRKLKPDETLTVVVNGPASVDAKGKRRLTAMWSGQAPAPGDVAVLGDLPWDGHGEPQAKLIIRAEKADAEAFQTGKLSFDEFRKKVAVMLY